MKNQKKYTLFALLLLCLSASMPVKAQETTGAILGQVTDSTGSLIPGVVITVRNDRTGVEAETTTDQNGFYQFPLLRASTYTVVASNPDFQRLVRSNVIVNTTERVRLDLILQVGQVTETVNVTGEVPLLQTERPTIGQVIEQRTIQSIPLATRNFTQILGTSAGVVGSIFNADKPGTGSDSVSVNGARRGSNNILVDGLPTSNSLNNAPDGDGTPSIEFLSEFKVLTSLYSAEYGRNLGSIINVTTRSGTNQLHGAAYEFLRNTNLNARPYFNPSRGQNVQNQFGANIGGPLFIPKLYNGKDRTFFFAGWESMRQRNANSSAATVRAVVPTLNQRAGNFGSKTITDPLTGQPFPGNVIPSSRIDPISQTVQDAFIPTPNFSTGGSVNFFAQQALATDLDQWTSRVDHRWSDKDSTFGRWFSSYQTDTSPFNQGLPGFGRNANRRKHSLNVTHTHLFSPTLIMEARFGFDRTAQFTTFTNDTDPATLGFQPLPVTTRDGVPRILINNYVSLGNEANWSDFINAYNGGAALTYIHSRHTVKYGFELRNNVYNPQNTLTSRGRWEFRGDASGDEYADFLLSVPRRKVFGAGAGELRMRDHIVNAFINDEWKVNPNLTVTAGVRYEVHMQPAAYNLDMTNWYPDFYQGVGSLAASGIVQARQNGISPSTVNNDYNNFMPRVGIAWRLNEKTVIRTGAGLFFDQRTGQIAQQAFSNPPTFSEVNFDCAVPGAPCSLTRPDNYQFLDPQYDPTNIPFPTKASDAFSIRATDRNTLTDNAWQYNFSLQRELPGAFLVETAYVGTKGTHLMARYNANPLIPQADGSLRRFAPGFGDILTTSQPGSSTYHSGQLTVKRRVGNGTIQGTYTFSKTIGNGNEGSRFFTSLFPTPWNDQSRAKGPANFDRTHRTTLVFSQDLPKFVDSRAAGWLLNNWAFNGFLVAQTGTPLTITNRDSGRLLGGSATSTSDPLFSDVVSGVPLRNDGDTKALLNNYLNKAAWVKAPLTRFGNSGRGMVRGPGQWNLDFSVFKNIPVTERFSLQFRTEFFNLLNHANFADPTTNLDAANFGQIADTSVNARLIQFALKLLF